MIKRIYISTGSCGMRGNWDWDDLYIAAEEDAYMEMPEGLEEWLDKHYKDQYEFDTEYESDYESVNCDLFIKLDHSRYLHYKMVWGSDDV